MNKNEITKYIFINDENPKGDLAFVFGTMNSWKESIEKTAELYKGGFVPKVIVSGGINKTTGIVEGDFMAIELEKLGIPKKDILIENKSMNTLENVLFSIEVIDKKIGLENIGTITAVVKNFHARRALMTLRKQISKHVKLKSAAYTSDKYPFTKENWHEIEIGKNKVMEEVVKIKTYFAKGDLAEL
ncbi:MAG TPA: YdcF family protein [Candidatus Paceibacterota bacterium]|nr:YdcF family protein [Candidatus Paceibacterota bacterium]